MSVTSQKGNKVKNNRNERIPTAISILWPSAREGEGQFYSLVLLAMMGIPGRVQ